MTMEKTAFIRFLANPNFVDLLKNLSRTGQHIDYFDNRGSIGDTIALNRDALAWAAYGANPTDAHRIKNIRTLLGLGQVIPNITTVAESRLLEAIQGTQFNQELADITLSDADKVKKSVPFFQNSRIYTTLNNWDDALQDKINRLKYRIHDTIDSKFTGKNIKTDPHTGVQYIRTPSEERTLTGRNIKKLLIRDVEKPKQQILLKNEFPKPLKISNRTKVTVPTWNLTELENHPIREAIKSKLSPFTNSRFAQKYTQAVDASKKALQNTSQYISNRLSPVTSRIERGINYASNIGTEFVDEFSKTLPRTTKLLRRTGALFTNPLVGRSLGVLGGGFQAYGGYNDMLDSSKDWVDRTNGGIRGTLGAATGITALLGGSAVAAPLITADLAYEGTNYLNNKYGRPYADKQMEQRIEKYKNPDSTYNVPGVWGHVGLGAQYLGDELIGIGSGVKNSATNIASKGYNAVRHPIQTAKNFASWGFGKGMQFANWWNKQGDYSLVTNEQIKQAQLQGAIRHVLRTRGCNI